MAYVINSIVDSVPIKNLCCRSLLNYTRRIQNSLPGLICCTSPEIFFGLVSFRVSFSSHVPFLVSPLFSFSKFETLEVVLYILRGSASAWPACSAGKQLQPSSGVEPAEPAVRLSDLTSHHPSRLVPLGECNVGGHWSNETGHNWIGRIHMLLSYMLHGIVVCHCSA